MGNFISTSAFIFKKEKKPLPIETLFNLPSPIPSWSKGGGFASGTIDLGGLQVSQVTTFNKIWASHEGGPDNVGTTIYEPSSIPEGFSMLGCYAQSNNSSLFGFVLVAKDVDPAGDILKMPFDYKLVWSSESSKVKQDGLSYFWLPTPPDGYKAIGHVVTTSSEKPSVEKLRCVRADFTDICEIESWIWGQEKELNANSFNVFTMRPKERGTQALGLSNGTFLSQIGGSDASLFCLKNVQANLLGMPNLTQIQELVEAYSPYVYFHPDEKYLPSTVNWYFQNGALLYSKGNESKPTPIEPMGSNLPQGGPNDEAYWLDLPKDKTASDKVKKGDLQDAGPYLHIKPMFGGTYTDIAIWLFYPFNGPARAKVEFINISLGKIGEHVGDWEHVTLRISNFNGELRSVYFSQHSKGQWVNAPQLEYQNGNKPVAYSSLNGHAFYPKPGLVLQGSGGIGIRNDSAKSDNVMDTGRRFSVVAAEYLKPSVIVEPPWLNYFRKWGPKISYDIAEELKKVEKMLPGVLKKAFAKLVRNLPNEVLGEDGPTGPKVKSNWTGDESFSSLHITDNGETIQQHSRYTPMDHQTKPLIENHAAPPLNSETATLSMHDSTKLEETKHLISKNEEIQCQKANDVPFYLKFLTKIKRSMDHKNIRANEVSNVLPSNPHCSMTKSCSKNGSNSFRNLMTCFLVDTKDSAIKTQCRSSRVLEANGSSKNKKNEK